MSSDSWLESFIAENRGVLRWRLRELVPYDLIEDVMQESFLRIFDHCGNTPPLYPKAMLFRIARNVAIDLLRRNETHQKHLPALTLLSQEFSLSSDVADQAGHRESLDSMFEAINQLPPKSRQVFILRRYEGLSHSEIGQRMGISVSTVQTQLARAIRLCHDYLEQQEKQQSARECQAIADYKKRDPNVY
ncbi:MAG: RNA polymerase sigma factor [Pseudomonadales bacterium]